MARPRTATNILDARGAFKKNPNRKREAEPKVDSTFPATIPAHLTKDQAKCWKEIVSITPAGVLTGADTIIVEVIAVLLSTFRKEGGDVSTNHVTRLTSEMSKIGLSPSARASLTVDKKKEDDFGDI